jgi:hypothetical protein
MTYTKQTWNNFAGGQTPIDADRLNHMEDGIEAAHVPQTASAVSFVPTGNTGASTVQAAIVEVAADAAADLAAHVSDASAAHAASAVSFTPTGSIAATDVQSALAELDAEKPPLVHGHAADTVTIDDAAGNFVGTTVEDVVAEIDDRIDAHLADAVDAHDASAVSFTPTGTIAATDVQAVLTELPHLFQASATGLAMYVPTPDYDLNITHPSVVDMGVGSTWNGYRYWMAFTPYPTATRENPCIVCSDDGLTWRVPSSVTNPLFSLANANAAGYGFNSDTHLIMLQDGVTMAMYWRCASAGTKQGVFVMTSTDGWVTKTAATLVLADPAAELTMLSPAVVHDGTNYRMYVVDNAAGVVNYYTCATHNGTFATKVTCTLPSWLTSKLWHLDVKRVGSAWYMLMNSAERLNGDVLYLLTSTDGATWTKADTYADVMPNDYAYRHYRSSMVVRADGTLDVYAAIVNEAQTSWRCAAYQGVTNYRTLTAQQNADDIAEGTRSMNSAFPSTWTIADNFERADTAVSLGTTTSGTAWSALTGTMGISGGKAYALSNARSVVESSISDVEIRVDISGTMAEFWVVLRALDDSNWWRIGTDNANGRVVFSKRVAGTVTSVATYTGAPWRDGDQVKIKAVGSSISAYRNGIRIATVTSTDHQTNTKHGIGGLSNTMRFNNFGIKAATSAA